MVAEKRGHAPPVVDAEDILANPRAVLTKLCAVCGIAFDEAMLSWPPGPKPFDGVWAPHWYNAAWASTGLTRTEPKPVELPGPLRKIADEARPYYEKMRPYRLI
jgi:hypothetical protein